MLATIAFLSVLTSPMTQPAELLSSDRPPSSTPRLTANLPDRTQLPDKDGNFVENYQEPPQGDILILSLRGIKN